MKNLVKRSIGVLLILLIMFSTLSGCVNPDDSIGEQLGGEGNSNPISNHTHVFEWVTDVEPTYTTTGIKHKECNCGEKTDENTVIPIVSVEDNQGTNPQPDVEDKHTHIYEWVTDVEPTYTTPGVKHKECSCGDKVDENTVADRLIHDEIVKSRMISNDSNMYTQYAYNNSKDLITFFENSKEKINASFLAVNATTDLDKGIYVIYEDIWVSYVFSYEDEISNILQEGYEPQEYKNPLITISYDIYSTELEDNPDNMDYDGPHISISFLMTFCDIGCDSINPTFEFYAFDDGNSALDKLIRVYNQDKCIGEIFYSTETEVDREWIISYLIDNLLVIK